MRDINATHDPARRSWVSSANLADADFPIQNLPLGRFKRHGSDRPQGGVAIGDQIVDLLAAIDLGLLSGDALEAALAAVGDDLLPLLILGNRPVSGLRARLSELLAHGGDERGRANADQLLVPQSSVDMLLPTNVRQYSDMCTSAYHIGRFAGNDERGEPICPPVFWTLPVGYDGRASSVVVSGTPVNRPNGTWQEGMDGGGLRFGPEPRQDYELEMGVWLGGPGNKQGEPISMCDADKFIFGLCLLNDWSSRGIQFWESMLGPFLGKSLATTASPWIVSIEALAPFRIPAFVRSAGLPETPWYLYSDENQRSGGFDIKLESYLKTMRMSNEGMAEALICQTNFRHMCWTFAQMIAHHASNGCALASGDLIGSGTCSGPKLEEAACLVELQSAGSITLPNGETRSFLEDGDSIILRARAEREGFVSIGFGEASGIILPARDWLK